METKFLSDGRKVAVIGKLNNDETIVQEVFVTEAGDELPSGERFVTKSLHDQPVKSYKDKKQEEAEARLAKIEQSTMKAARDYHDAMFALKTIQATLKQVRKFAELVPEDELEVFTQFLTGTVEYLVVDDYSLRPPIRMIDFLGKPKDSSYCRDLTFGSIKLVSVLGSLNGGMKYTVGQYSDESGSNVSVHPFVSLDRALEHITDRAITKIEKGHLSIEDYKSCLDMGIKFPKEVAEKFFSDRNATLDASYNKQMEGHQQRLNENAKQRRVLEGLLADVSDFGAKG